MNLFKEVFIVIKNNKECAMIFFILESKICREQCFPKKKLESLLYLTLRM
jgi:hypothetical protein